MQIGWRSFAQRFIPVPTTLAVEESAVEIGASLWSFAGLLAPDCVVVPLASPDDKEMDMKWT